MEFIKKIEELSKKDVNIAGGKGSSLGEIINIGISVPEGFVILSTAFEKFLEENNLSGEINAILDTVIKNNISTIKNASDKIMSLMINSKIPEDVSGKINLFFNYLNTEHVAVRSSATAEDSKKASWAGQLESYLNTTEKDLLDNVKRCWASLFLPRAISYRFEKGMEKQKISVAVLVQKMVNSEVSGVIFSAHPVTKDTNQLIIEACSGLGEALASGKITPDTYIVEKNSKRIIKKNVIKNQALSDEGIIALANIVLKIENHFGFYCDIEWTMEGGNFFILQSRPITTLQNG